MAGGPLPRTPLILMAVLTFALLVSSLWRRSWELPLHFAAALLLGLVAVWAAPRVWWVAAFAALSIFATFGIALVRSSHSTRDAETKADQLAVQVDRRISELFSLQELSYVLSESIQLDRVVDQVVKYAARFLQAEGAIVVLVEMEGKMLRVVSASGTLESLVGRVSEDSESALVRFAIGRDRIEVAQGTGTPSVELLGGIQVRSAAVAPLRAQGITMGALAVADRRGGPFTTEDLWLLSTVATNASVVLANSRLYEMVRRGEEEWETAFNALAEGIAVVGPTGAILRANRALAGVAQVPESELVGRNFSDLFSGASELVAGLIEATYRHEKSAPLVVRLEENQRVLRLTAAPRAGVEPGSAVILIEDVTEQQMLEAQIIQNDKMASIGQLVSGVAHELNNPLTSITGLAELLLERPPHPELPREHLRVIHDQAERASRIVRNLVTNAVQAVTSLPAGHPRHIRLSTSRSEGEAVLRVRDSGPGIAKHLTPYLFTPFFTTKAPGE